MDRLSHVFSTRSRTVVGLMSGTSLDGIDVVVARIEGSGPGLLIEPLAHGAFPFPAELRADLLRNSDPDTSSVKEISQLNVRLALAYADAVKATCRLADTDIGPIDLVGSHGQTIHHIPDPEPCAGIPVSSTLQIGDPSVLAQLLGVPVVGDFRVADMALGGQGAPLVPYFDYVTFTHPGENRLLLNLGGIANLTWLPASGAPDEVIAFDTGPANMVLDALADHLLGLPFDPDGHHAGQGNPDEALLSELLAEEYLLRPPPKSTGRERYGAPFVQRLLTKMSGRPSADILATAAALTIRSVHEAYNRFLSPLGSPDILIVSGGGLHNQTLLQGLAAAFAPIPVGRADSYGIDSDLKEALCFAVLAHETVNGVPTNLPSVTGASRPTLLGKICLPTRPDQGP